MKKQTLIFSFILLVSLPSFAQNVDSLVNRFVTNTGGIKLYEDIKTFSLKQTSLDTKIPYESNLLVSITGKEAMRTKTILSRSFIYKLEDNKAQLYIPTGGLNRNSTYQKQNLSDFEKRKLQMELEGLWSFVTYESNGYKATFIGESTITGKKISQISFKSSDATILMSFVSATGIPTKQEITYSNGEKIEIEFSDFVENSYGIKYPQQTTTREGTKVTILKNTLEINKLKDTDFSIN
jgi:outer membrane lipoprotein-sorting protein